LVPGKETFWSSIPWSNNEGLSVIAKNPVRVVTKRLSILALVLNLSTLALWTTGNARSFLDSTQTLLLKVLAWDSMALAVFAAVGMYCVLFLPPKTERGIMLSILSALLGLAGYLLLIAIALVGILFSDGLVTFAGGFGGK
jgi:hypothetical protein